jgi:hypothetical protein
MTAALDHNIEVVREVANVVAEDSGRHDLWVHGFVVGIALALRAPITARELRQRVESTVADANLPAERIEVYLREVTDLFNRKADE